MEDILPNRKHNIFYNRKLQYLESCHVTSCCLNTHLLLGNLVQLSWNSCLLHSDSY